MIAEPPIQKLPAGHGDCAERPLVEQKVPAEHSEHEFELALAWKVPTAQLEHKLAYDAEYDPGAQGPVTLTPPEQ